MNIKQFIKYVSNKYSMEESEIVTIDDDNIINKKGIELFKNNSCDNAIFLQSDALSATFKITESDLEKYHLLTEAFFINPLNLLEHVNELERELLRHLYKNNELYKDLNIIKKGVCFLKLKNYKTKVEYLLKINLFTRKIDFITRK